MKKYKLSEFYRGWFIGNFNPSIFKTEHFEVGILEHKKGEVWPAHYHKIGTEYNVLIVGHMSVAGNDIRSGDIFVFDPGDVADPIFHEDCQILCVKVPSIPGDKYAVF
jgi:quercetin dioxygenase-like cupin family protein